MIDNCRQQPTFPSDTPRRLCAASNRRNLTVTAPNTETGARREFAVDLFRCPDCGQRTFHWPRTNGGTCPGQGDNT